MPAVRDDASGSRGQAADGHGHRTRRGQGRGGSVAVESQGSGAQAFGWGLYFAEDEAVAKSYQEAFRRVRGEVSIPNAATSLDAQGGAERLALEWLRDTQGDFDQASRLAEAANPAIHEQAVEVLRDWKQAGVKWTPPNLYTLNLKVDDDQHLDWDKPLR